MKISERVYIGGLNPPTLTVQHLLDRLQSDVQGKVQMQDFSYQSTPETSSYCHMNAISLTENQSALEVLRKLYNNVMWKGCKIKVEGAKPHFLSRLVVERQERQQKQQDHEQTEIVLDSLTAKKTDVSKQPPRHLRIKRGYGEQSLTVDTKPCQVNDWESFARTRQRLQVKSQKEQKMQGSRNNTPRLQHTPSKNSFWNRSVHLRFLDNDDRSTLLEDVVEENTYQQNDVDDDTNMSSSTNVSTSASDSDGTFEENGRDIVKQKGVYVWSDDDDDDETTSNDVSDDDDDDGDHEKQPSLINEDFEVQQNDVTLLSKSNEGHRHLVQALSNARETDEFDAGILNDSNDDDSSDDDDNEISTSSPRDYLGTESFSTNNMTANNLEEDVQTNLNILANIFPEFAGAKAADVIPDNAEVNASMMKPAWNGQMLRFDPTKHTVSQFVVRDLPDKSTPFDNGPSISGKDVEPVDQVPISHDNEAPKETDQEVTPHPLERTNIYEQKKLEEVFAGTAGDIVAEDNKECAEGFSFGFFPQETPALQSFSFSFDLAKGANEQMPSDKDDAIVDAAESEAATMNDEEERTTKRQRGLFFPEEDISRYVNLFYSWNDGKRIRENVEAFRKDPSVQESWDRQRKILTQDWRRKHKLALQKRRRRPHR